MNGLLRAIFTVIGSTGRDLNATSPVRRQTREHPTDYHAPCCDLGGYLM